MFEFIHSMNQAFRRFVCAFTVIYLCCACAEKIHGQYCAAATSNIVIIPTLTSQCSPSYSNGVRAFNFLATAGCTYEFTTCGQSSSDTYLRLYSTGTGGTVVTLNDDFCGLQSQITWTAPANGTYSILLTRLQNAANSCSALNAATAMCYRIVSCGNSTVDCLNNDSCLEPTPIALSAEGGPSVCITDCNTGSNPGPEFQGNNCYDFPNGTVWYSITTGLDAASINVAITSTVMTNPEFTVFTNACGPYTIVECLEGSAGNATINSILVSPSTTYLIAVSNWSGSSGEFQLCVSQNADNSACNTNNSIAVTATSLGSPLGGPYQPGEQVTFCYTITDYQQVNCNYLGAVIPSFGDCWAPSSFNSQGAPVIINTPLNVVGVIQPCPPGPPCAYAACAGTPAGTWNWFPAGTALYNVNGSLTAGAPMPAGWYFLSSYSPSTGSCTGDPTDPDVTFGDGNFPQCEPVGSVGVANEFDYTLCFTLIAKGSSTCAGATDCAVSLKTYADGEFGVWNNVGCTVDAASSVPGVLNCCTQPVASFTGVTSICSGQTTAITLNSTIPATTTYNWTVSQSNVSGAVAGSGNAINQALTLVNTALAGTVTYTVIPTSNSCVGLPVIITITVNPSPVIANFTSQTCSGIAFNVTPSSTSPNVIPAGTTYSWSAPTVTGGITGGATGSGASIVGNLTNPGTTAAIATYTVTATSGTAPNQCSNTFTLTVTVNPRPSIANIPIATCSGTPFTVIPVNSAPNIIPSGTTYSWVAPLVTGGLTGGVAGNGNSITGTLVNSSATPATATYTVTAISGTAPNQCSNTFNVVVTVNPITPTPLVSTGPSTCASAGSATIINYVNTQTYTFSPAGPTVGAGGVISGLISGTSYTVSTTNGNCPSGVSAVFSVAAQLLAPAAPIISTSPATCAAAGSASVINYVATQSYTFNPTGPTVGAGGLINGLTPLTNYTVITSNANCPSPASISFAISGQLPPPIVTGSTSICPIQTTQLTGSGTPATATAWTSGNTSVATVSATGLVTGIAPGVSTITYTNSSGCQALIAVTVNALPTITGNTTVCPTLTTQLSGTATPASINPWVSGNTAVATVSSTGLVTGIAPGSAVVTYTNSFGCQTNTTVVVSDILNWANLQFPTSPQSICAGSPFTAYGRVYNDGAISTISNGVNPAIEVDFGYSISDSNPATWTNWFDATYGSQLGNDDEYLYTLTGLAPGTYYYTFRYRINNCVWQYGGFGGFWNGVSGVLTVVAPPNAGTDGTVSVCASGTPVNLFSALGGTPNISGTWAGPSGLDNGFQGTYDPIQDNPGTYTYTIADPTNVCPPDNSIVSVTESSSPQASVAYASPVCANVTAIQSPVINGAQGGTFSATPAGLGLTSTGTFNPTTAAPGTYTITYTIDAASGCSAFQTQTTVVVQAAPIPPALNPVNPCSTTDSVFTATGGNWYEFLVDGVSTGPPSANAVLDTTALAADTQVCVRSYPQPPIMDGNLTDAAWTPVMPGTTGGPASQAPFSIADTRLDGLKMLNRNGLIYFAVAGNEIDGTLQIENNRILLFIDSKPGGFNSLSAWVNRSNAPPFTFGVRNLDGGIQFDPGFEADYIISINRANLLGTTTFYDLYDMVSNSNVFLGSSPSAQFGYLESFTDNDLSRGFEFYIPLTAIASPVSLKVFGMLVNDPGEFGATLVSNQFFSVAGGGDGNYGNGSIFFGQAAPNPVSYVVSQDCFEQRCVTLTQPVVPLFVTPAPICAGGSAPVLPTSSNNVPPITGTWSGPVSNQSSGTYTFTPVVGQCATGTTLPVTVNAVPVTVGIFHD